MEVNKKPMKVIPAITKNAGKGDFPRPVNLAKYKYNFESINWHKENACKE